MGIAYKRIEPISFGGAGNGNTYRFEVTENGNVSLAACERDVASAYRWAGLEIPKEVQGPYDGFGNKV